MRREHVGIPSPTAGLKYDAPSTMISNQHTPDCSEVRLGEGMIQKALGDRVFASTDTSSLTGTVMKCTWLQDKFVVHTTSNVYWLVSGSFVSKTDAGGPYTGDEDNRISTVWMTDLYIWCNGTDGPREWDLSGNVAVLTCGSRTPGWLTYFGGRLCMYNVDSEPRQVRYSVVDDPEDYTGSGSGANNLTTELDENDTIQRAERMANYVVIYGKYSIAIQEYRGEYLAPFGFRGAVPSVGLAAPDALITLGHGGEHIFLGAEDIYSYSGGREAFGIGGPIREQLFREIDPQYANRSFMVYLQADERIRLHYPSIGESTPNRYFEYNINEKSWTRGARSYTGYGSYVVETAPTWDTAVGTWDEQTKRWDDRELGTLAPLTMYGTSGGGVYEDKGGRNVAGALITSWWDSKDFAQGAEYRRTITNWMGLTFEARGDSVDVYYSTDQGATYTLLEEVTLTENWEDYEIHFNVDSELIRFRFKNETAAETFAVRWIEPSWLEASERKESVV